MPRTLIVPIFFAVLATASAADFPSECQRQWHQWRGPLASGTAPYGDPPVYWDEMTHIKWKVPSPLLVGDRLYFTKENSAIPLLELNRNRMEDWYR